MAVCDVDITKLCSIFLYGTHCFGSEVSRKSWRTNFWLTLKNMCQRRVRVVRWEEQGGGQKLNDGIWPLGTYRNIWTYRFNLQEPTGYTAYIHFLFLLSQITKIQGSKTIQMYPPHFLGKGLKSSSLGSSQVSARLLFPWGGCGGESISLPISMSRDLRTPWFLAPSLPQCNLPFPWSCLPLFILSLLPLFYKDAWDYNVPIQIIQDHLTLKISKHICKVPSSCKATRS